MATSTKKKLVESLLFLTSVGVYRLAAVKFSLNHRVHHLSGASNKSCLETQSWHSLSMCVCGGGVSVPSDEFRVRTENLPLRVAFVCTFVCVCV